MVHEHWTDTTLGNLAYLYKEQIDPNALGKEVVDHFSLPAFDEARILSVSLGKTS